MKFYGQFVPPLDKIIWNRFFKNRPNGFFIECGAHDGESLSSCKFFEESMGWKGINIEAVPTLYEQLVKNRPDSINIHAALSDHVGTVTIRTKHETSFFGTMRPEVAKRPSYKLKFEVPCTTYEKILDEHNIDRVSLMVLDVEGHEMVVIDNMLTCDPKKLPRVFCVEHSVVHPREIKEKLAPIYKRAMTKRVNSIFVKA